MSKLKIVDPVLDDKSAEAWLAASIKRARIVGPFSDYYDLTPAMARALSALNEGNRHLLDARVKEYAAYMKAGEWEVNGETIIISDTGHLNDGQHRVHAVIESGVTIRTNFSFGTSRQSRKTVDTGAKRTSGHVLAMAGVKDSNLVSAAARFIINYNRGLALSTHHSGIHVERQYNFDPSISESAPVGRRVSKSLTGNPSLWVALHYLMAKRNREKADTFFDLLCTGENLAAGSPILALRIRLLDDLKSKAKLPMTEIAAISIKAMNAYMEGRRVKLLRWTTEGETPEAFPRFGK